MYSSTSAGCWYLLAISFTTSRSSASLWQTLLLNTPLEEPSATGFTMSGKLVNSLLRRSLPVAMSWKFGVWMPAWRTIFFASALSSAMESVAGSEPV